jgi:hypothetical protein
VKANTVYETDELPDIKMAIQEDCKLMCKDVMGFLSHVEIHI